jgi:hypothetical protein
MQTRCQKKLSTRKVSKQHQAEKDTVVVVEPKTIGHKTIVKKDSTIHETSGEHALEPVVVHTDPPHACKDKKGKKFRALNKKTPGAIEIQKLMTAFPQEAVIFKAAEAPTKNQIAEASTRNQINHTSAISPVPAPLIAVSAPKTGSNDNQENLSRLEKQSNQIKPDLHYSVDAASDAVIKAGFKPEMIGKMFLDLINQENGTEKVISFAVIIARAMTAPKGNGSSQIR